MSPRCRTHGETISWTLAWVPPRMQPLALGAAVAFGCSRKMGQMKEKEMYLYVKWNSFGLRFARRH
jgi:hypothetical protein